MSAGETPYCKCGSRECGMIFRPDLERYCCVNCTLKLMEAMKKYISRLESAMEEGGCKGRPMDLVPVKTWRWVQEAKKELEAEGQ